MIAAIVVATQGNQEARAAVEQVFPQMQQGDWGKVPAIIQRIWTGERDWHSLCAEIDREDSLFILRVLEELEKDEG